MCSYKAGHCCMCGCMGGGVIDAISAVTQKKGICALTDLGPKRSMCLSSKKLRGGNLAFKVEALMLCYMYF